MLIADLTEVPVPTRFIFIQLGPVGSQQRYHEVGRSIATLMSDEVICHFDCQMLFHTGTVIFLIISVDLSLASVKSRLVLPFWYRLTRVVPEKGQLNRCVCVCVRACVLA